MKIVADSSANLHAFEGISFTSVPLKIITAEKEYTDDSALNVGVMLDDLKQTKGRTRTSCPNVYEWKAAAGEEKELFFIAISGSLSGSFGAASKAAEELLAEDPTRKIAVINSLTTGPEMQLLMEKIRECANTGLPFEETERNVRGYMKSTHLLFALQCMENLAKNGRVNPLVAKLAGLLGIRAIGEASPEGTLQMLHKCRGMIKTNEMILEEMIRNGYRGGRVRIAHCRNESAAMELESRIHRHYPRGEIEILPTGGLCSFYAEEGGLLVGYES